MVLVRIVTDRELVDCACIQKQLHVLACACRKDVRFYPHAYRIHALVGYHADDLMPVVLVTQAHPRCIFAREELVACRRQYHVAIGIHVTEGKRIRLDMHLAVLAGLLELQPALYALVL